MLITLLVLIGLVIVAMIATKFMHQDRSANQYKRRKFHAKEPKLSSTDAASYDDADAVLGLKPAEPQQASLHEVNKVKPKAAMPLIITLNLVCDQGREYSGYELLQAILSSGMRFGDMKIFHRHEQRSGRGDVLFSMASMMEPGTFDLPSMGSYHTPGLSFFLCYDRVADPRAALNLMVDTISDLRDELGGDIYDAKKRLINKYNIAEYYDLVDNYVRQGSATQVEELT